MGSIMADLPDASSPSLILTQPTHQECIRTWSQTHPKWGPALSLQDYLDRESYLSTVPVAKDGGITRWILTDPSLPPDHRPILSSCEALRKRAVYCKPTADGKPPSVVDGLAHGMGSVWTDPQYRGKGYASRMMRELVARLREYEAGSGSSTAGSDAGSPSAGSGHDATGKLAPGTPLFSVLYSDIGKKFYARSGWAPFASAHLSFPPATEPSRPQNGDANGGKRHAKAVGYHEIAELCSVDEKILRETLPRRASDSGRTCVALLPNLDSILWHLMREDFMTKHIFGRTPVVRGAVYGEPGRRVWAVWTRGYYGGLKKMEGNTLHILRFVIEAEDEPPEYLADAVRSIVQIAQAEALEWRSQDVQTWNPSPELRRAVEQSGLPFGFVDRDNDSIASLMWYGEEPTSELDWVLNEKFAWC